ncbi:MAG: PilW family protein [Pseudomonadales bacterium]
MRIRFSKAGFTLLELLITLAIAGVLVAGLTSIVTSSMNSAVEIHRKSNLQSQAHLAMRRMVEAIQRADRLTVPQRDNVNTGSIRENFRRGVFPVPAGWNDTAVLAVTLDGYSDIDLVDGADRDNDGDGRVNEDPPADWNFDYAPGLWRLDDDGDGEIDEGDNDDDDEDGTSDEDWLDGIDNDGDGRIDEDPGADVLNNGCPGLCGTDDDGDDLVDETFSGGVGNDDEDNLGGEDWLDLRVFHMSNNQLLERIPAPFEVSGTPPISGRDFVEEVIAYDVVELSFERLDTGTNAELVRIELKLENEEGERVELETTIRVGTEES